ncbi:FmdE family protein [Thermoproteota archaeon]
MRVKSPKLRQYSGDLEDSCIEFHGHGGPFMVVGLKMGLAALMNLDAFGWFDIKCKVFLNWAPPDSCVIDGIQISTGCTMGKHNIVVVEQSGVMVEFTSEAKLIRLQLKNEVLEDIRGILERDGEAVRDYMDKLVAADESELFNIEIQSF